MILFLCVYFSCPRGDLVISNVFDSNFNIQTLQSTLNISHNELVRFAPSVELFWCATLKKLHLDFNCLEEITESMVKLCKWRAFRIIEYSQNPPCTLEWKTLEIPGFLFVEISTSPYKITGMLSQTSSRQSECILNKKQRDST